MLVSSNLYATQSRAAKKPLTNQTEQHFGVGTKIKEPPVINMDGAPGQVAVENRGDHFQVFYTDGDKQTRSVGTIKTGTRSDVSVINGKAGFDVKVEPKGQKDRREHALVIQAGGQYHYTDGTEVKLSPDKSFTRSPLNHLVGVLHSQFDKAPPNTGLTVPGDGEGSRIGSLGSHFSILGDRNVPKMAIPLDTTGTTTVTNILGTASDAGFDAATVTVRPEHKGFMETLLAPFEGKFSRGLNLMEGPGKGDRYVSNQMNKEGHSTAQTNEREIQVYGDTALGSKAQLGKFARILNNQGNPFSAALGVEPVSEVEIKRLGAVAINQDGHVVGFHEKPKEPSKLPDIFRTADGNYNANVGIVGFSKRTLKASPAIVQRAMEAHEKREGKPIKEMSTARHLLTPLVNMTQRPDSQLPRVMAVNMGLVHDTGTPSALLSAQKPSEHNGATYWPGARKVEGETITGPVNVVPKGFLDRVFNRK